MLHWPAGTEGHTCPAAVPLGGPGDKGWHVILQEQRLQRAPSCFPAHNGAQVHKMHPKMHVHALRRWARRFAGTCRRTQGRAPSPAASPLFNRCGTAGSFTGHRSSV